MKKLSSHVVLVFPHQLFSKHPLINMEGTNMESTVVLAEEFLFFRQYSFHPKKLILHRASMKSYQKYLEQKRITVQYIDAENLSSTTELIKLLHRAGVNRIDALDPCDDWLNKKATSAAKKLGISLTWHASPGFICEADEAEQIPIRSGKYYMTNFYIAQRKRLGILVENGKPIGGKWTFDSENRKRLPKNYRAPEYKYPQQSRAISSATSYVTELLGVELTGDKFPYPVTRNDALRALDDFLEHRFSLYGDYQDAISKEHSFLHHSLISSSLNIGLLTPNEVLNRTLAYHEHSPIALNSLEGFIRQIIGWREFIRLVYLKGGRKQRSTNFWGHSRKLPKSLWTAETGIDPVDCSIRRVVETSYAHHIERLMVLGNFMLLCEYDPDEVYRWFMSLFIDAYDWVMVPNVYGMSQYADGGLMTTKPYVSSSNYIRKMGDFPSGAWAGKWDALFWRFVSKHRSVFETNPRMNAMCSHLDRMGKKNKAEMFKLAEQTIEAL